jgi:catechol 2,3-dioxygenase
MAASTSYTQRESTRADMAHVPALHHVNLKTARLQEMIDWYGLVVGLRPTHQFSGGAWLTNDEANHRLALLSFPSLRDDPDKLHHAGIHHTAFEYSSLDQLLDTYQRLQRRDIVPHACLDHGMTISFYYVDPDGNSVELQADNFGDWAQSTAFMTSDPRFAENPIGVSIDPDRMLAARAQGDSAETLHTRADRGDFTLHDRLDLRVPMD